LAVSLIGLLLWSVGRVLCVVVNAWFAVGFV